MLSKVSADELYMHYFKKMLSAFWGLGPRPPPGLSGFPLYFGIETQGLFKNFQGPWSCMFKEQFSTEVYSMDSITAIFNIYFCDYGTVLVGKNKTW